MTNGVLDAIAVLLGGGIGSAARFWIDSLFTRRIQRRRPGTLSFPWGITVVNLTGSFVLGLLLGAGFVWPAVGTGLLGGYTTFSTASLDTVRLLRERRYWAALGNAFGTFGAALALAVGGLALGALW